MLLDVGPIDDFREGEMRVVTAGADEVGVLRWEGQFFALRNTCPHQFGPLCRGRVRHLIKADVPGQPSLDQARPILTCPWHGWEFDARTGESLWDSKYRARTVPVHVSNGRVLVLERRR